MMPFSLASPAMGDAATGVARTRQPAAFALTRVMRARTPRTPRTPRDQY
jgi:hypothetical protein